MRLLLLLFVGFIFCSAKGQEVLVLEKGTEMPLSYVAIYNRDKSKSTVTAWEGKADLSKFSSNEILIFKHISHLPLTTTKQAVVAAGGKVYLVPDENHLQEVVLSVSRFKQRKQEIPQKTISIKPEDIAFANSQTSADLMQSTGKVYVQKSQLGGGSPMIRGFATNRLLITVDGVRMNTAIFRGGNLQNIISIDPLAINEVEVILGPGSVVFGSDAIGGVMNFYTLKPKFSYDDDENFSGSAFSRYATANGEKTVHTDFNLGYEKWAFLSSITFSDFNDLRMGSYGPEEYLRPEYMVSRDGNDVVVENEDPRVQVPTGYNQINLLQKIAFQPNDLWDFNVGLYFSTTSDYDRYDRLYQKRNNQLRSAQWYYGPQTWFSGHLQVEKRGLGRLYDKAKFTGAYQFFEESRNNRDYQEVNLYHTKEHVDAFSGNLDFEKIFGGNKLFYGLEYVLNLVGSIGTRTDITSGATNSTASRYPDGSLWQSIAAYSGFQWNVNKEVNVQLGTRYNRIILQAEFDDSFYDFPFSNANLNTGSLTGSAGINWQPNKRTTWRANVSTAFRAPNVDDIGKVFDSEPGSVVVPNPNLEPEYAYNAEVGLLWKISEAIKFDLTTFYTILEDAMVRRDFILNGESTIIYQGEESRVQAIQNVANAYVYGFEVGAEINFSPNLRLISQLTSTNGEEEQDDGTTAPLRHAAPLFGNTHLVWKNEFLKFDVFSEYNGEFAFEDLAPSEQGKAYLYAVDANGNPYAPSWYTINFTGQYIIDENWRATASVENITDQRYRTYSSGITSAGRNLILAVKYTF